MAYGCRCVAELLPPGVPAPPRPDPLPTEEELREQVRDLGLTLATLGVGRALWVGVPAALNGIRTSPATALRAVEVIVERVGKTQEMLKQPATYRVPLFYPRHTGHQTRQHASLQ